MEKERKETMRSSVCCLTLPTACNSQVWARPKPGVFNSRGPKHLGHHLNLKLGRECTCKEAMVPILHLHKLPGKWDRMGYGQQSEARGQIPGRENLESSWSP